MMAAEVYAGSTMGFCFAGKAVLGTSTQPLDIGAVFPDRKHGDDDAEDKERFVPSAIGDSAVMPRAIDRNKWQCRSSNDAGDGNVASC